MPGSPQAQDFVYKSSSMPIQRSLKISQIKICFEIYYLNQVYLSEWDNQLKTCSKHTNFH